MCQAGGTVPIGLRLPPLPLVGAAGSPGRKGCGFSPWPPSAPLQAEADPVQGDAGRLRGWYLPGHRDHPHGDA